MLITRRRLLGAGAAAGVAAALARGGGAAFAQLPAPRRLPLSEFAQNGELVDALRRGVQAMRDRKGSDPRSWFWQGAVHAYSDEIYDEAVRRDPAVAKIDAGRYWMQCPHFGQSSANFLIWHRAYLYHFERILRAAAGEPELAIPYWNYDEVGQRGFPEMFAPQYLDQGRKVPNPLYHPNREAAFVKGLFTLSEPVCAATRAHEAPQFFSAPGVTGFGGDVLEEGTRPGAVEQRPHNDLHVAVGGSIGSASGAMADVPTAAFDPIFWVHHANVDRLWRQWASTPGKSWGPLPPDSWFDEAPWTFIDADGSEQKKPRRFYLDPDNLAILYADAGAQGDLALPLSVPGSAAALASAAPQRQNVTRALFRNNATVVVPADRPATSLAFASAPRAAAARVPAMRRARTGNADAAGRGRAPAGGASPPPPSVPPPPPPPPGAERTLTVRLSGIAWARLPATGFAVYLAPRRAALDEGSPYFLGTLNLFGTGVGAGNARNRAAMHQAAHMGYQDFDATRLLGRLEQESLEVQILPYALLAPTGATAPPRADGVRIAEVSLLISE